MDNSMASRPPSPLRGDPYGAYEELPAEVRLALQEALVDWCPLRAREWHRDLLRKAGLKPAQAAHVMVQTIRREDQAELVAFARRWAQGAAAYPHVAAGATRQRYAGRAGMPAAEPIVIPAPPARAKSIPKAKSPAKAVGKATGKARAKPKPTRPAGRRRRR